jgi:3-hydroxyisobutyrate dehydrogenase-like beta-hydroxyacid dehydrogenase
LSDATVRGLLHPGEMGSAVGATLRAGGARVLWAPEGRSAQTRKRAEEIGLEEADSLEELARRAQVIVSVVPPHGAVEVARALAALRYHGQFVDANAVSPETARKIGRMLERGGAHFVDGGIIGPANRKPGAARIYLSGPGAARVASLFSAGPISAITLDAPVGAASALKMAFAGWNKGMQALLMSIRALAMAEGVDQALLAEWAISMPEVAERSGRAVRDNTRKAWRFVGEMEEIARTFVQAGLPPGFHDAAGEIYRRLSSYKGTSTPPPVDAAIAALLKRATSSSS